MCTMSQNITLEITDIYKTLHACNFPATKVVPFRQVEDKATYLIDDKYIIKISASELNEATKQKRAEPLAPKNYTTIFTLKTLLYTKEN